MKISKAEGVILLILVSFLSFSAGWFFHSRTLAQPLRVETERTLEETVLALPAPTAAVTGAPGRVNVNTAGEEELQTLPGIGPKRAADIVADREKNGPYRFPEDLLRVPGIGTETLAGLEEYIAVEGETP